MSFSKKHPLTSVTPRIEALTSEQVALDDLSGIPDLVAEISYTTLGPTEAARQIRKKLKYGSVHRQLRALTILDGIVENTGTLFARMFQDEMLLERLRVCGKDDLSNKAVKEKCDGLFRRWAVQYKSTPELRGIANLYKDLPRRKQQLTQERSKVVRETEQDPFRDSDDEDESKKQKPSSAALASQSSLSKNVSYPQPGSTVHSFSAVRGAGSSSGSSSFFSSSKDKKKKDKSKKPKVFNLEQEKESIMATIGQSSVAATNLMNTLKSINREQERVSENANAVKHFEMCKKLRRKVLRYIQLVYDENYLGGLISANDELVTALMTFEQLDQSVDADSDSEDEIAEQAHLYRMATERGKAVQGASPTSPVPEMAGLNLAPSPPARPNPPPRPSGHSKPSVPQRLPPQQADRDDSEDEASADEDDNDPFGDKNAVLTPAVEKGEPKW